MTQGNGAYNREMFKDTFENEFTRLNGFLRNVRRSAEKPALTCPLPNRTWTYSELDGDCNIRGGFISEILEPGTGRST